LNRQRQRRIVAPNLNERISESVWKESRQQSCSMLNYLVCHPGNKTIDGLRNVAINVLGHSGYGQTQPWSTKSHVNTKASDKEDMTYFKAISLVTIMLIEAAFLPPILMKLPFMPASLRLLGHAMENLPRYTNALLNREREAKIENGQTRTNLLSMMVQLSDQEKSGGKTGLSLTEAEISGNLFLFSAAGFDTTANTMAYAVTLLAAHPEWQDWIKEELLGLDENVENWKYEDTFPKCKRVLAVMVRSRHLRWLKGKANHDGSLKPFASSPPCCIRFVQSTHPKLLPTLKAHTFSTSP
jgi:Cytochrome P450